ncbi:hypothetical protein KEM56_001516 [Ascosphaera pollenicola]|nr:hypothetical protein KEM56_001516 [Ascosphaera pollenicola]
MTTIQSSLQFPSAPYAPGRARSNPDLDQYGENPASNSTTNFLSLPYSGSGRDLSPGDNGYTSDRAMYTGSRSNSGEYTPNPSTTALGAAAGSGVYNSDLSRAPVREYSSSDADDDFNTQSVVEKFMILPDEGMIVAPEAVEADDYLHNPDPTDSQRDFNFWNRRGLLNLGGLLLVLFSLPTTTTAPPPTRLVSAASACLVCLEWTRTACQCLPCAAGCAD